MAIEETLVSDMRTISQTQMRAIGDHCYTHALRPTERRPDICHPNNEACELQVYDVSSHKHSAGPSIFPNVDRERSWFLQKNNITDANAD